MSRELHNSLFFKGTFRIEFPKTSTKTIEISIINSIGQSVYSSMFKIGNNENTKEISLKDVSPGVYFIQIKDNEKISKQQILIQN